jgi:hypothetical protein
MVAEREAVVVKEETAPAAKAAVAIGQAPPENHLAAEGETIRREVNKQITESGCFHSPF